MPAGPDDGRPRLIRHPDYLEIVMTDATVDKLAATVFMVCLTLGVPLQLLGYERASFLIATAGIVLPIPFVIVAMWRPRRS